MALGADEIEALATATATATKTALQGLRAETATVNAVAVKLPIFWSGNPEVWFTQVESCFATRKITVQKTQFDHVIQALDNSTADRVQAVILNPSETPYDTLKAALIDAFGKTQAQKDQEILNINGLGDKTPKPQNPKTPQCKLKSQVILNFILFCDIRNSIMTEEKQTRDSGI